MENLVAESREFLSLREEDFVIAARLTGMGHMGIIFRHMLPSFMSRIIASLTLAIPGMILAETALSFLGLGIQPPQISWGGMLSDGRNFIEVGWWLITISGLVIMATCLASNILGDWLRDTFDPMRRQLQ